MKKPYILLISLLVVQVKSDLIDDARDQLDELDTIVQGSISAAHDNLSTIKTEFLTNSDRVLTTGTASIQQEEESINRQLSQLKNIANGFNVDISSCLEGREDILNGLPKNFTDQMSICILDLNDQQGGVVSDAVYIVDVSYNKVQDFKFQFGQCREDILCISPLVTEIQLDKIRLPQNIRTEVDAVNKLLTSLRILVGDCSETRVRQYATTATVFYENIAECANRIIG